MKSRARNISDCAKCREQTRLDFQYEVFANCIDSAAISAAIMAIGALDSLGLTDDQLKEFFEKYVLISGMTHFFGEAVREEDVRKRYEERLGIDFDRIECHYETKAHFMARYRRETKNEQTNEKEA